MGVRFCLRNLYPTKPTNAGTGGGCIDSIMGSSSVKHNLSDFLMERNFSADVDAVDVWPQLKKALSSLFAQGTAVLFFLPAKSPEADSIAWGEAISAFTSAIALSQHPNSKIALVVEEANLLSVPILDVFGSGNSLSPIPVLPLKHSARRGTPESL